MNAKNIITAFNNEVKSFNTAIRFVFETAALKAEKIPAAPAKDDRSEEAKALRKSIKKNERYNAIIDDCRAIVAAFNITSNDIKGKQIKALRDRIVAKAPLIDTEGRAVKMVKMPSYLKTEIADYSKVFAVAPASWIETIIAATENTTGKQVAGLSITAAPVVSEGKLTESASGDIVDANAEMSEKATAIFETWNRIATYKNIANSAGRAVTDSTFDDLKKNAK